MKKLLLFSLFFLCIFSSCVSQAEENTADRVHNLIGGVCASLTGEKNMQDWISSSLSEAPAADWYAITLSQMGAYDLSSCKDTLLSSFENTSSRAAVTRQKFALALIAIEADISSIQSEADETIGSQGIMSWVYGLHLLHNGFVSKTHTENSVVDTLLSLQFEDGGWALSGAIGNIDVTAMTMQALAPYMSREDVKSALERATDFISTLQEADGGYKSYGVSNPESAAQVIVALTAMGIDPFTDARFIKNGNTLLDAIDSFHLENGAFSHTLGGAESPMATVQTLYGLVSYERMLKGQSPFYTFDKTEVQPVSVAYT
ncbi:MAG: terpene cyclase/mutase family protein, partial [Clostridia bacterium]|nr:terpene cyclase/mutase family protein [Clostridia bacterium]